jgi:hypothetical protein
MGERGLGNKMFPAKRLSCKRAALGVDTRLSDVAPSVATTCWSEVRSEALEEPA